MTLAPGTKLGPYEILAMIGAGGMGEVYRAKDPRLSRDVAVKVLPEEFFEGEERRTRFEREARLLAALNHPGIAAIYSFEEIPGSSSLSSSSSSSRHILVMELLEGETLRQRLGEGPIPQRKVLEFSLQIAQALAAAHDKGIVHRDLKPENLFLTSEGRVKILDFGLAKAASATPDESQSPTLTATEPGTVMGTVGYMSPEQVRGKPADRRSDIFSLGSIVYEMLSGERAFRGDSAAETMAAIAQKDPPELAQPTGRFTPSIDRVLRHCLEKRPEDRFDTARDLAFALETAVGGPSTPGLGAPARASRRLWPALLAGTGILAAFGAGLIFGRVRPQSAPRIRQITYHRGLIEDARFSPDGLTVVFGSTRRDEPLRTHVTRLDSVESRALDLPAGATVLGISGTGEMALLLGCAHRGYWMRSGTLARVALGGGAPREILEHVADGDISPDGREFAVVREAAKIQRLEFPIGKLVFETDGWVSHPRISPDGKRVAFLEHPVYGNDFGYVSWAPAGGRPERLTAVWAGAQGLAWSRDGKEIWFTASTEDTEGSVANGGRHQLWAVRPGGKPRLVYGPPMDLFLRDISPTGAALLTGEDRRGEVGGLLRGETRERDFSTWKDEAVAGISGDGSVYTGIEQSAPGAGLEPFLYYRRVGESAPVRLGNGSSLGISPDGRWVLKGGNAEQGTATLTLVPTGPGEPRTLPLGNVHPRAVLHERARWSLDGRRILFPGAEPGRLPRTYLIDLAGGGPRPATPEGSSLAILSPDGESVASVDEGGRILVYPVAGGVPREVRGALPGDLPLEWEIGGKALFVWDRTWPARIHRLELDGGRRSLWKELAPDPVGLLYGNVILTPDGKHYVYRLRRVYSELNVVEGLR